MSGAGFMRAGVDPAGVPSADRSPDALSLNAAISRRLDPVRGDYDSGLIRGDGFASMPIVLAKVLMAVGNKRGSFGWDAALGDQSLSIDRDNGKMVETVTAYTRAALAPLVDAKEIEIISVRVQVVDGAFQRDVTFRDISTDKVMST